MSEELESIILASSTQLITLNTRITQKACNDLDTIRGWLQTTGQMRAITKQVATDWAIQYACNALCEEIARQDLPRVSNLVMSVSEPIPSDDLDVKKVIEMHAQKRKTPTTAEELKAYYGCK